MFQVKDSLSNVIGPIEQVDWKALLNIKALIKEMQSTNTGEYQERIQKYKKLYSEGIGYYLKAA